ncbi:hypothetical protein BTVI_01618 [Pitangus sulphuratus]|nr:hypothetical protein BTVI_01618 [Pitangus sulphuratus]
MEKIRVLHHFLPQSFTSKFSSHTIHVAEVESRDWENKELPTVGDDQIQEDVSRSRDWAENGFRAALGRRTEWIETSSGEKDLGLFVNEKLNMT